MRNIVCISGTSRPENFTSRAMAVIVDELRALGETVTVFDARDLDIDFPGKAQTEDAVRLKEAVSAASGVILAGPEYHGSVSAMTKLIIENLGFPSVLAGKPVALAGVAAGRIGAIKSLEQLKNIISHVGGIVVPGAVSIAGVRDVFDDQGESTDQDSERALRSVAEAMHRFLTNFVCPRHRLEEVVRAHGKPWSATV